MPLLIGSMRFVVAFVVATALFWAGLLFEHRPHGWPNLKVAFFHLSLPDGPWARLEAIAKAGRDAVAHTKAVTVQQAQVSREIGLGQAVAQERIRTVYRTITKEIPTYVTPEIDRTFRLPVGLIRVHDAAAFSVPVASLPDAAGQPDDAASPITASQLGQAVTDNYGSCTANAKQLTDLQEWVRAEAAATR